MCKGEKDRKVRSRVFAVRMVRMRNLSVEEAADHLMQCPNRVRNWLRRYDKGGPGSLQDLLRSGWPRRIPNGTVDGIVARMAGSGIIPEGLQRIMHEETGRIIVIIIRQPESFGMIKHARVNTTRLQQPCLIGYTVPFQPDTARDVALYNEWGGEALGTVGSSHTSDEPRADEPRWQVMGIAVVLLALSCVTYRKLIEKPYGKKSLC